MGLRQRINAIAHSDTTVVTKIDGQPVRLFYNVQQKQKKQQGAPLDCAHHSNQEVSQPKITHKEKWPIPSLTTVTETKRLFFGSTYPDFLISETPVNFESFKWQFETLEVQDPNFCYSYLTSKDTEKCFALSNPQGEVFGVIRAVRVASHPMPTSEQVEQASRDEIIFQLPYAVHIHIMPINFVEFWSLILNRRQASDQTYEFYKWKIAFDKYRDCLPPYYNDYLNSYFKYLQIPQDAANNIYL